MSQFDWNTWIRDGRFTEACTVVNRFLPDSMRARFEAADFVQEAIAEICAAPERSGLDQPALGLVITIARRRLIDEWRRPRERIRTAPISAGLDVIDGQPSSDELVFAEELMERVIASIRIPRSHEAVQLRLEGYRFHEIESMLGWRRGSACKSFKRLRQRALA